jgi:phage gp36-like protein
MSYATRTDVENIFGRENVRQWADLENEQDEDDVEERITWALNLSEARVDSRLRESVYVVPFDEEAMPLEVVDVVARQAGVYLHDGRNIKDQAEDGTPTDAMKPHRKMIADFFTDVLSGRISLSATKHAPTGAVKHPTVVNFESLPDCPPYRRRTGFNC